ncbi:MAG: transposase [bacterium]
MIKKAPIMPIKKTNQAQLPIRFGRPNVNLLVSEDAEIIKLWSLIQRLDFSKFYSKIKKIGAPNYKPEVMLALILMAISDRITSSRKIEKLCYAHIDYIFVAEWGTPDHSTIARFITNNKEEIIEIGKQFIVFANRSGISRFKELAMDGTKIQSYSSKNHSYTEAKLNEQIIRVEKAIKTNIEIMEGNDIKETEKEKRTQKNTKLIKSLAICNLSKIKLTERKKTLYSKHREKHQINVKENDARYVSSISGCGYNVQYVVDTSTGLIVVNEVMTDQNDAHAFKPNIEKVEEILGNNPEQKFIADSGYSNSETLSFIEEREIDAIVNDIAGQKGLPTKEEIIDHISKFNFRHFVYIKNENRYMCPNSKYLEETEEDVYECKECMDCQFRERCCKKKESKVINQTDFQKQRIAMMGKEGHAASMNRRKIVERKFGQLKWNLGLKRFTRKQLDGARVETALIALSINLYSVLRHYFSNLPQRTTIFKHLFPQFLNNFRFTGNYIIFPKNLLIF